MYEFKSVPIPKRLAAGRHVQLVSLDVGVKPALPLAIAHYTVDGQYQPDGLRLDLDKRIVLDILEDNRLQSEAEEGAKKLFAYLATEEAAEIIRHLPTQAFTVHHTSQAPMTAGYSA